MKLSELKVGTKLELEIFDELGDKIYPSFTSKFESAQDENTGILDAPIFEGRLFPVHIGSLLHVYFIHGDNLYRFKASISDRILIKNLAYIKVKLLDDIQKVQRRRFYRLKCSIPVKYRVIDDIWENNEEKNPYTETYTTDISGGGICIKTEKNININSILECDMTIYKNKNIQFTGKVVRCEKIAEEGKYKYEVGVVYRGIDKRDNESIIKFIFEEQRRLRRKGII